MRSQILSAALCLACVFAFAGCREAEDAALLAVEAQPAPSPRVVACVGDSNTEGYGATSYTTFLVERLGADYTVENLGVSGTTAMASGIYPYAETLAYSQSLEAGADIVVLMLGTNDTSGTSWRGAATFAEEYEALVATYLALDLQPRLILCTPPAPQSQDWPEGMVSFGVQPAAYAAVNDAVRATASRHSLPLVDIYTLTEGQSAWFLDDGIHLADEGASAVADAIGSEINNE